MTLSRSTLYTIGVATVAATFVVLAVANFVSEGENGGTGPFIVTSIVAVAAAALLFGWYAPRADRPARAGIVAAILGLLTLPAFWSGLPIVLGGAATALGAGAAQRTRTATVAVVLGMAAVALCIAGTAYDHFA